MRRMVLTSISRMLEEEFKSIVRRKLEERKLEYPQYVREHWLRARPHEKYIKAWMEKWFPVIQAYCSQNGTFKLDPSSAVSEFPFRDEETQLSDADLIAILEAMVERGLAEKLNGSYLIFWLSTDELVRVLREAASDVGLTALRTTVVAESLNLEPRELFILLRRALAEGKIKPILGGLGLKIL